MSDSKPTIGSALDKVLEALAPLDERGRRTVLDAVISQLDIEPPRYGDTGQGAKRATEAVATGAHPAATPAPARHETTASAAPRPTATHIDILAFKEEKKPSTNQQMACVVAYYLSELVAEEERRDAIANEDIEKYFKQARFPLPKRIAQLLPDAKAAGYFELVERGKYKLSRVGYNLVAHRLPPKS